MKTWKVGFAGSSANAREILESLTKIPRIQVPLVISRSGNARGGKKHETAVTEYARGNDLPLQLPENQKQLTAIPQLQDLDLLLVVAYGMRIPDAALDKPAHGCINVHYSMLPRWRGAAPVAYALLHGDTHTGVSIFKMAAKLDEGPILCQQECPVAEHDTSGSLLTKLNLLANDMLAEVLPQILQNRIKPVDQSNHGITYAPRITATDRLVDWQHKPAAEIERLIRAMYPQPLARTIIADIPLLLHRVGLPEPVGMAQNFRPGSILHNADNTIAIVATDNHSLQLLTVQAAGKKPLPIAEFLNGRPELRYAQAI